MKQFIGISVLVCLLFFPGCKKSGWDLGEMTAKGEYDKVIEIGDKMIAENPDDWEIRIIVGNAYQAKARDFNAKMGVHFTPEGAALAKIAIKYYMESNKINRTRRASMAISEAGTMTSEF